jgi:DNA polymerase
LNDSPESPFGRALEITKAISNNLAMNRKQTADDIVAEIDTTLQFMKELGCRGFDCSAKSLDTLRKWGSEVTISHETLESVRLDLGNCKRCSLCKQRSSIVFGAGDSKAQLVFVGEGPGYEEDKSGEPFVGAAGKLLTKIIEAIHLTREQVYICNIIKCRPPGNRNPLPEEIDTCFPFLKRQLSVIKPNFICALGTFAAQTLLDTKQPISRLRGQFHDYMGIQVMPTYHPAYLLRNANKKREVWEDMKALMKEME